MEVKRWPKSDGSDVPLHVCIVVEVGSHREGGYWVNGGCICVEATTILEMRGGAGGRAARRSRFGRSSGGGRTAGDGLGSSPAAGSDVDRGRRPTEGAGRGEDQGLLVGAGDEGGYVKPKRF